MKNVVFLFGLMFFNLCYGQEHRTAKDMKFDSLTHLSCRSEIHQTPQSVNNSKSDLYQYVAWTEPTVIRKDYDVFRIVFHSKISEIVSISWHNQMNTPDLYLERDGIKLQEVTLYDDGTHGDEISGDGLLSCDRLFLQGEIDKGWYYLNSIGSPINLLPYGEDLNVKFNDGHEEKVSPNQLLDYSVLQILLLDPDFTNPLPKIMQLSDSVYATEYLASIRVPVDTIQILNKTGWPYFPDVSKSFYKYFEDDIDFMLYDFKPLWQIQVLFPHNVSNGGLIKNETEGIDQPIIDYSPYWGSNRLQYIIPSGGGVYNNILTYTHEILHRWISTLSHTLGITSYGHHWGFIQRPTTGFGFLRPYDGVTDTIYRENDSTFCRGSFNGSKNVQFFNDLELYLMGLMEIDSVKFPIITLPKGTPVNNENYCYTADSLRKISRDEFLTILGNRIPTVNQSQKKFRFTNLLISTRKAYPSEIYFYDQSMRLYEMPKYKYPDNQMLTFEEATGGRASMGTKLTPKNTFEPNYLPQAIKPILRKKISLNGSDLYMNLDTIFVDPDGDILTYKAITSDSTVSSVNIWGHSISIHPEKSGSVTCMITALDDRGGTTEISFVIEITNINDGFTEKIGSKMGIYPNPANTTLFIKGQTGNTSFTIYNSSGQQIITNTLINNQIDISNLEKGIYFLRITEKKRTSTERFIKL